MVPLPTSNQPKGFIHNDELWVLNFIVPCSDGYFQQAYWVKQLGEGQVAGLPQEYTLGQTLFVTEIYATLAKGDRDDNNLGPIHSLPHWLLAVLTGPAMHYRMLLKQVEAIED
jgi:hypothetical protein